jgi:MoaA/NifB/PqqE/SkfB family radical SAM enzyme
MLNDLAFAAYQGTNHIAQRLSYQMDRQLGKPNQVTVLITDVCAARCVMCDIWKLQENNELTIDEWKTALDRLREWLGPFFLVISGGEPFQKRGIFDFLAHCRSLGIKTKMSTNGMYLTRKACDRVLQVGPDFLSFSIDHHRREVHDTLRGVPLHDRCVDAIGYLRGNDDGIVLGVATIVMEETAADLVATGQWALGLGVDRILYQPLYPTFATDEGMDPSWYERNPHWPRDPDAVASELEQLRRMKAAGTPVWNPDEHLVALQHYFRDPYSHPRPDECMVRYNAFNIDPRGDVTFCYTVDDRAGSLRVQHPREIWESEMARQIRDKMKPCKAPCLLNCYRGRSLREQVGLFRLFAQRQGF